jgi:hypothetical protein
VDDEEPLRRYMSRVIEGGGYRKPFFGGDLSKLVDEMVRGRTSRWLLLRPQAV